jgi:Trk-type K+ transport system membrane component
LVVPLVGTVPYLVADTGPVAHPVNALFWYVLRGRVDRLTSNTEFRWYLLATATFGAVLSAVLFSGFGVPETVGNVGTTPGNVEDSLRQGLFQVIAIVTTTGYASMDVNQWDASARRYCCSRTSSAGRRPAPSRSFGGCS